MHGVFAQQAEAILGVPLGHCVELAHHVVEKLIEVGLRKLAGVAARIPSG